MKYCAIIEGLQILAKYQEQGLETYLAGADHDIIWGAAAEIELTDDTPQDEDGEPILTDTRISAEDAKRLDELGWFIDDQTECWSAFC